MRASLARLPALMAWSIAGLTTIGCGNAGIAPAAAVTKNYEVMSQAEDAFKANRYADALTLLTQAIDEASLQADVLADAYLKRAICKFETGDAASAGEDLDKAEQGGASPVDVKKARARKKA